MSIYVNLEEVRRSSPSLTKFYLLNILDARAGTVTTAADDKLSACVLGAFMHAFQDEEHKDPRRVAIVASFFNLPNHTNSDKLTASKLAKNFIGWNEESSNLANMFKPLIFVPVNSVRLVLGTAYNIVKTGTEFLPRLLENLLKLALYNLLVSKNELSDNASFIDRAGYALKNGAKNVLTDGVYSSYILVKAVRLILGSVTSPLDSFERAVQAGRDLGGKKGALLSGVLGLISTAISVVTLPFTAANIILAGCKKMEDLGRPKDVEKPKETGRWKIGQSYNEISESLDSESDTESDNDASIIEDDKPQPVFKSPLGKKVSAPPSLEKKDPAPHHYSYSA